MPLYDGTLQMFVESPREPDMARLTFVRWLAEQGRLEHPIAGPSSGPLAPKADDTTPAQNSSSVALAPSSENVDPPARRVSWMYGTE